MNILYVSYTDLVGGRFNGYESFPFLRAAGHSPAMLTWEKTSMDPAVHRLRETWACKIANALGNRLDKALSCRAFAVAGSHWIPGTRAFQEADVVHLELLHAAPFFSLLTLPRIARLKPAVWTLHDPWAITGHCVHPLDCARWKHGCGQCPDLRRDFPVLFDTTAFAFRYKQRIFRQADLDIIVASRWMRRLLERSPMFADHAVHVVPFGIDLERFTPEGRDEMRRVLRIRPDAFVVFFRHSEWGHKGAHLVVEALLRLETKRPVHVLTVQKQGGLDVLSARFPVTELGWLGSGDLLAAAYAASDVFVVPSHESFCMMALESLACGTPLICLEHSAVTDFFLQPEAGLSFSEKDPDSLVAALTRMIDDEALHRRLREQTTRVAQGYSMDRHARTLLDIYADKKERHAAKQRNR